MSSFWDLNYVILISGFIIYLSLVHIISIRVRVLVGVWHFWHQSLGLESLDSPIRIIGCISILYIYIYREYYYASFDLIVSNPFVYIYIYILLTATCALIFGPAAWTYSLFCLCWLEAGARHYPREVWQAHGAHWGGLFEWSYHGWRT